MTSFKFGVTAATFTVALLGTTQAMGATWELKSGKYSKVSGALHETFDTLSVDANEAIDLNWTGNSKVMILEGNNSAKQCFSPATVGKYLCVRGTSTDPGRFDIDLSATPTDYYGFRWGSIDWYNTVSFYDGDELLLSLTGSKVKKAYEGQTAGYLNVYAEAGQTITRVLMESSKHSMESDNHALRFMGQSMAPYAPLAQVPEPSTYALLLAGLGLVGFAARRNRR